MMTDTHLYKRDTGDQFRHIKMQPLVSYASRAMLTGNRPFVIEPDDKYLSTTGPLTFSRDSSGSLMAASPSAGVVKTYRTDPRLSVGHRNVITIGGDAGGDGDDDTRYIRSTSSNGSSLTIYGTGTGSRVSFTLPTQPPGHQRPSVPLAVKDKPLQRNYESRQRVVILGADTYDPVKHAYTPAKFQEMCKAAADVIQRTWNIGMDDRLDVVARGLAGPDHVAVDLMKRLNKSNVPAGDVMLSLYPPAHMTINCRYACCCDKDGRLQGDHTEFSKAIGRSTINDFKQLQATRLVVPDDWNPHSDAFSRIIADSNFVIVFYHTEAGRLATTNAIPPGVDYVTINVDTLVTTDDTFTERTRSRADVMCDSQVSVNHDRGCDNDDDDNNPRPSKRQRVM